MYYKQISEGYEDQDRFDILMKVGMSRKEVKQSINSQVLTVFFLPLIAAGVHLAFAFPLISQILMLLSATEERLLILVTVMLLSGVRTLLCGRVCDHFQELLHHRQREKCFV